MPPRLAWLSPKAATWLKAEIRYIAQQNPEAAEKIAERLRAARISLAQHALLGRIGEIPGTRRLIIGPYILTYRVRAQTVEVWAIGHARMENALTPEEAREPVDYEPPNP